MLLFCPLCMCVCVCVCVCVFVSQHTLRPAPALRGAAISLGPHKGLACHTVQSPPPRAGKKRTCAAPRVNDTVKRPPPQYADSRRVSARLFQVFIIARF